MKILLIGKPGSGKGSVTQSLGDEYIHFSTGNLLRQEIARGTPEGLEIKALLDKGGFATNETIFKLVDKFFAENKDANIIFDGFPRNVEQASVCIKNGIEFDYIFELVSDNEILEDRIVNRRVHEASGRVYHLKTMPPKVDGKDDVTGEPLVQRNDDRPDVLQERLRIYEEVTAPVLDVFREAGYKIHQINANETIQKSVEEIKEVLNQPKTKHRKKMWLINKRGLCLFLIIIKNIFIIFPNRGDFSILFIFFLVNH